jgi:hypothetical protein
MAESCGDAHAEADPGGRVEDQEREIARAPHQGERTDSRDGDDRADREDPSAPEVIREPAAEEIARHRAAGADGEEPHHRVVMEAEIHRMRDLVGCHDLVADRSEGHHAERRPQPRADKGASERPLLVGGAGAPGARGLGLARVARALTARRIPVEEGDRDRCRRDDAAEGDERGAPAQRGDERSGHG